MARIRPPILAILAIVAVALAAILALLSTQNRALARPGSEPPGSHGILVLGSEPTYGPHLPMVPTRVDVLQT